MHHPSTPSHSQANPRCGAFPLGPSFSRATYIERVIEPWHRSCPHGPAGDLRGPATEIPTPPSDHTPLGGAVLLVLDSGLLQFNARMTPIRANIVGGPPARRRLGGFQSGGLSKFMRDAIARRSALRMIFWPVRL